MLDRREREIDIEFRPTQVVGAGPLDAGELPDRGVLKPWELLERHEQVVVVNAQP
jgi:hypothetical protein